MSNNQIKSISENLIDEVEGTLKTIKIISKKTKEEKTPKELLNNLIDKVETSLNFPGTNTVKDTFKVLIDIMAADFIVRLMSNLDQTTMVSILNKEVFDGITRFSLATMLLYPYLIENKLELKPEVRDLTEKELNSIENIKKSVKIISYLSYFNVSALDVISVFLEKNVLKEKDLTLIGLTSSEISTVKERKDIDPKVKETVMKLYNNYDSIASGKSLESYVETETKDFN